MPAPVAGSPYVLVVEDDAAFATLVSEHLAEVGLAVHISPSAEEALARTHTATPALIFLDIHLAGNLDGWDFLTTVKADARFATIPVIITTVTEKRARGLALGAADYLVKPFPMERLLDAMRRHLPAPQGRQVLIADDDAAFRGVLAAALLAEFGSQVHETGDGHDALAQIQAQAPDLVILDLLMPGLDGFEVLKHLRLDPRTTHLPVLVVTGVDLTPADKERLRHGMARVLTKAEYSQQNLLALVRELVNPAPTAHGAATGDMP